MEPTDTTPEKKKRGRPPLPPELKATTGQENSSVKKDKYAAQKKYQRTHPEKMREIQARKRAKARGYIYEPRLRLTMKSKEQLEELCSSSGLSITKLFCALVKEKYGVELDQPTLKNKDDKS